jgi:hypothetical protein
LLIQEKEINRMEATLLAHCGTAKIGRGGLLLLNGDGSGSITKLDGITGQPYPTFAPTSGSIGASTGMVVHPDGTVFALQANNDSTESIIGINPVTGSQLFNVPFLNVPNVYHGAVYPNTLMIAGDGYAYVAYSYGIADPHIEGWHLHVLRVNTAGQSRAKSL